MPPCLLMFNAGSSSHKAAVFSNDGSSLGHWHADMQALSPCWTSATDSVLIADQNPCGVLNSLLAMLLQHDLVPVQVGHRVVHGGTRFVKPTVVDDHVLAELDKLASLAPLHNPSSLAVLHAARVALPAARHVAMFDTAFHATIPPVNYRYAIPAEWSEGEGIRRFGFHGFSHAWSASRARAILGEVRSRRLVVLHLGQGCSATAILSGKSHATTMGFTPLDGLPMGTRSGAIDPGALLHLLMQSGMTIESLSHGLWRKSGWLALSGCSSDFRVVSKSAEAGNSDAAFAIEFLAARCCEVVASLAATMGGIDALVFTGGIGENVESLRLIILHGTRFLGILAENVLVVPAQEEQQMVNELVDLVLKR